MDLTEWLARHWDRLKEHWEARPDWLLPALGVAAASVVFVRVARKTWQVVLRRRVGRVIGDRLPPQVSVRLRKERSEAELTLRFPRWRYARVDGARDRRYSSNGIVEYTSTLCVSSFVLSSKDPLAIYWLARMFRYVGIEVPPIDIERAAGGDVASRAIVPHFATDSLLGSLRADPAAFEHFCADLFRRRGFEARVAQQGAGGGFDIRLRKGDLTCLVACECFGPEHPVGRPLLQKMAGANRAERADRLICVTTSRFTRDAEEFARRSGMELIDGEELTRMHAQEMSLAPVIPPAPKMRELTYAELRSFYPPDYWR